MIQTAISIAQEAGRELLKHYGTAIVSYKEPRFDAGSMVTDADLKSEKLIAERLREHFPTHGICGEEGYKYREDAEFLWAIDPLDGTSNFARNIPLFGISVGLLHRQRPVLGVLYFPSLDLLLHAEEGKGAYANGEQIHVSPRALPESLYYAGGICCGKSQIETKLLDKVGFIKIIEASSYELAQIAMGNAELYVLENVLHDVAAGIVVVQEAGGRVSDKQGRPWSPTSQDIVVSNGKIHDDVINFLKI